PPRLQHGRYAGVRWDEISIAGHGGYSAKWKKKLQREAVKYGRFPVLPRLKKTGVSQPWDGVARSTVFPPEMTTQMLAKANRPKQKPGPKPKFGKTMSDAERSKRSYWKHKQLILGERHHATRTRIRRVDPSGLDRNGGTSAERKAKR